MLDYNKAMIVYEVLRVINKKPLFLEAHMDRFEQSIQFDDSSFQMDRRDLQARLDQVIKDASNVDFNIRIEYDTKNGEYELSAFYPEYPTRDFVRRGVSVKTIDYSRENPNIKWKAQDLRKQMDELKEHYDVYEMVYCKDSQVLEGSKTNIFFIKGNTIYTSPSDGVLEGITRKMVIQTVNQMKMNLEIQPIKYEDLQDYESAFLTGTSINILPIVKMDEFLFSVTNPILLELMQSFEERVKHGN